MTDTAVVYRTTLATRTVAHGGFVGRTDTRELRRRGTEEFDREECDAEPEEDSEPKEDSEPEDPESDAESDVHESESDAESDAESDPESDASSSSDSSSVSHSRFVATHARS